MGTYKVSDVSFTITALPEEVRDEIYQRLASIGVEFTIDVTNTQKYDLQTTDGPSVQFVPYDPRRKEGM